MLMLWSYILSFFPVEEEDDPIEDLNLYINI